MKKLFADIFLYEKLKFVQVKGNMKI